jgi:4-amino-4-deoxy-L-arabinose transferase-like glycosyltransferase
MAPLTKQNEANRKRAIAGASGRVSTIAVLLGGILVLATALRLLYLGRHSYWTDEIESVFFAGLPWPAFVSRLVHDEANMTVYYLLLRPWLLLGTSEPAVRSLSVVFSVATIPLLYALAARMFGSRVGLIAALLVSVNAFHVAYAQNARSYSLLLFLLTIASLSYIAGVERPTRRSWITFTVASVLAVYSHFFAIFVLVAQWASLIFLRSRDIPWKAILASALAIGLFLLPLVAFVATANREHIAGIPKPKLDEMFRAPVYLAGAGPVAEGKVSTSPEVERRVLLVAYFAVCLAALRSILKLWRSRWGSFEAWHHGFVLSWLFVPLIVVFGVSMIMPLWIYYYLIICLPPLVLLAAYGFSTIDRQWVLFGVLAAVTCLATYQVSYHYRYGVKEDWRGATRYVLSHARAGDAVVFGRFGRRPFTVYRDLMAGAANALSGLPLYDGNKFRGDYRRIWLLVREGEGQRYVPSFPDRLLAHTEKFEGVRVLLYSVP